jgi:hypothetical protein
MRIAGGIVAAGIGAFILSYGAYGWVAFSESRGWLLEDHYRSFTSPSLSPRAATSPRFDPPD